MRSLAITAMAQTVNTAARPAATTIDHRSNRLDIIGQDRQREGQLSGRMTKKMPQQVVEIQVQMRCSRSDYAPPLSLTFSPLGPRVRREGGYGEDMTRYI